MVSGIIFYLVITVKGAGAVQIPFKTEAACWEQVAKVQQLGTDFRSFCVKSDGY